FSSLSFILFFFDGYCDHRDLLSFPTRRSSDLSNCAIADIRIDFHQKVPSDDHGFAFRMIDIIRNNRPSRSDLLPYKLRGDLAFRGVRSKAKSRVLLVKILLFIPLGYTLVFTDSDIFHLCRNDALLRIVKLRHVGSVPRALRPMLVMEAKLI